MALEFEEQDQGLPPRPPIRRARGITGMLIKKGVVKNKKQANYLYLALIVVLVIIMYMALSSV